MITVYVDASVQSGRPGGAGVVIVVGPPMVNAPEVLSFAFPTSSTVAANDTEIMAFLYAAVILRGVAGRIPGLTDTIVQFKSDSAAAISAVKNPRGVRNRQTRALAKNVRQALDQLSVSRVILGWHVKKIARKSNLADKPARSAREEFGSIFSWTPETAK